MYYGALGLVVSRIDFNWGVSVLIGVLSNIL